MPNLTGSVGARARNRPKDVANVQKLLNQWFDDIAFTKLLLEDGLVGRLTLLAIVEFQGRVVGMEEPDARVDPGGLTWRTLNMSSLTLKILSRGGAGYYTYGKDEKRFATSKTIASIQELVLAMERMDITIGIGNISLKTGGQMPPHTSHQRGVDVDIRPMRIDQRKIGVTIHSDDYSRSKTRKLVRQIRRDKNLEKILFNDTEIAGVRSHAGHDNHLHVRYKL